MYLTMAVFFMIKTFAYLFMLSVYGYPMILFNLLIFVAIAYFIGCGGSLNQSLGQIQFGPKGSYSYLLCTWSIGNVGIEQAVALMSIQELSLSYY